MSRPSPFIYHPPPGDEYFIHAKLRKKPVPPPVPPKINKPPPSGFAADGRERLLQLAEKSRRGLFTSHRASYCTAEASAASSAPAASPRMGIRMRGKAAPNRASAIYSSEQSLPDKLTAALKSLRPSALSHSASSSAPFKSNKLSGVVDADDVVYIPSNDRPPVTHRFSPNSVSSNKKLQRKARSIFLRASPSQSDLHRLAQLEDPPLRDLEQIRALYKSSPNVSSSAGNSDDDKHPSEECKKRYSTRYDEDSLTEVSTSTRSPTDSGYRSASRHLNDDSFPFDDGDSATSGSLGVSHKTTTVVLVNGASTGSVPGSPSSCGEQVRLRCNIGRSTPPVEEPTRSAPQRSTALLPFSSRDVVAVLQSRRCRPFSHFLDATTLPKLVSLLEMPLHALTDEIKRICTYSLKTTVDDVITAIKVTFPLEVFSSCVKAGLQATTLFALSGTGGLRKSMSRRAELCFSVGKIYRWLIDCIPGKPMSDTVAVFVAAALECALEEFILRIVDSDANRIISLRDLEERLRGRRNLCEFFIANDPLSRLKCPSTITFSDLIDKVHTIREQIIADSEGAAVAKQGRKSALRLSVGGIRSLHYYVASSGAYKPEEEVCIADWVRISYAYAEHRMALTVDEADIQQAARVLLRAFCPPVNVQLWRHELTPENNLGEAKKSFAFQLIATANQDNIREACDILEPDKLASRNNFGLCPLSEAILQSNADAITALLSSNCPVNCGVPSPNEDRRPYLLKEYTAWTPLTWAVAKQRLNLVQILLNAKADIENEQMIKESPLQVAVQLPQEEIARALLERGADPFRSSVIYDSLHAHFRNAGCASALALAASRGNDAFLHAIMQRDQGSKAVSMSDFLNGGSGGKQPPPRAANSSLTEFDNLAKDTRLALQEAIYYAVETCRPEIALEIKNSVRGLHWNIFTWSRALQAALEQRNSALIERILSDFGAKLAAELSDDTISDCLHVLFGIVRWQSGMEKEDASSAAAAISRLHHYLREMPVPPLQEGLLSPSHRPLIDHHFINNQQFSDVKFMVNDRPIYGHRIVLINASEKFKELLQNGKTDTVVIKDVSYRDFLSMMEFIYTGQLADSLEQRQLLPLLSAARLYSLPQLAAEAIRILGRKINSSNFVELYTFAVENSIDDLTTRCERFLLEHFALLMSDQAVRRLFSQKRIGCSGYNVPMSLSRRLLVLFDASRKKH